MGGVFYGEGVFHGEGGGGMATSDCFGEVCFVGRRWVVGGGEDGALRTPEDVVAAFGG